MKLNSFFLIIFPQPARSAHWIECAKGAFNTEPRKSYSKEVFEKYSDKN